MALPMVKTRFSVISGRIDCLEGSQKFSLISWLRFELDETTVLVHGLFLLPPRLAAGDEVVVSGRRRRDGTFDAYAVYKPEETESEGKQRSRQERRRRITWLVLQGVPLALLAGFGLWFGVQESARHALQAMLLLVWIAQIPHQIELLDRAALELALVLARDEQADATGPAVLRSSSFAP